MHAFDVITAFLTLTLVGVEFSVSAFVNPAAWRLEPGPQLDLVSRLAWVLGRVMPVWYPLCALLLGIQTFLCRHTAGFVFLLLATGLWVVASVGGIFFLVPLNTRIAARDADWQRLHHRWDGRHRVRTAMLATAAVLLVWVLVH